MKVFPGLHKTVDDRWTSPGLYLEEQNGIICQFSDGSAVVVVSDGRVLQFDALGRKVTAETRETS